MRGDAQFTHAHMVRFERTFTGPAEEVWAVLTDIKRLPHWYGDGVLEPRVGGRVELMGGHVKGVVTQWLLGKKLAYTWNVLMPGQTVSDYPESYLTLEIEGGTLILTHLPILERFVKANAMGWHTFLDMVDAELKGESQQPRSAYMKRNAELYGVDLSKMPS